MRCIISATLVQCSPVDFCVTLGLVETNDHIESFIHDELVVGNRQWNDKKGVTCRGAADMYPIA